MASGLVALKDIPSISSLYRAKELNHSSTDGLPTPNQEYNNKICTVKYDLTKLEVDAIVNAANESLLGGGGVDGAIHRAAGPDLVKECRTLDGCRTGSAKITQAYRLPCKKVIHAVGPVYYSAEESESLLRGCYRTALQLAADNDCKSIAFSAISTGIYGYPSKDAAIAAIEETRKFLERPEGQKLDRVIFCNFLDKDVNAYSKILPLIFPPTKEDLTPASGEYDVPQEDPIPGEENHLPTTHQTRPRAVSRSTPPDSKPDGDSSHNSNVEGPASKKRKRRSVEHRRAATDLDKDDLADDGNFVTTGTSRTGVIEHVLGESGKSPTRLTDISLDEASETQSPEHTRLLEKESSNANLKLEEAWIAIRSRPYPNANFSTPSDIFDGTAVEAADSSEISLAPTIEQNDLATHFTGHGLDLSINEAAKATNTENIYEYFRKHGDLDGYRYKAQQSFTEIDVPDSPISHQSFRDTLDRKRVQIHKHDYQYDNGKVTQGLWPAQKYTCKGCGSVVRQLGAPEVHES